MGSQPTYPAEIRAFAIAMVEAGRPLIQVRDAIKEKWGLAPDQKTIWNWAAKYYPEKDFVQAVAEQDLHGRVTELLSGHVDDLQQIRQTDPTALKTRDIAQLYAVSSGAVQKRKDGALMARRLRIEEKAHGLRSETVDAAYRLLEEEAGEWRAVDEDEEVEDEMLSLPGGAVRDGKP